MFRSPLVLCALLSLGPGCATSDQVVALDKKVEALEKRADTLEKRVAALERQKPVASPRGEASPPSPADEAAAQDLFQQVQDAIDQDDYASAKAKMDTLRERYSTTNTFKRARRLANELAVIGKDAPKSLDIDEWYQGVPGDVDLQHGTTMLVFWEIWCPHCRKHVPKLEDTYQKYKGKGLKIVALTRLTRDATKDKVLAFIHDKQLTFPVAKDSSADAHYFNVTGIPAAAVVRDGRIVWRGHPGRLDDKLLESWLEG